MGGKFHLNFFVTGGKHFLTSREESGGKSNGENGNYSRWYSTRGENGNYSRWYSTRIDVCLFTLLHSFLKYSYILIGL